MSGNLAYYMPLVILPSIITFPGQYVTRRGEIVTIDISSQRHDFGCAGAYADGTVEGWHRSGRLMASRETVNDIVRAY